LKTNSRFEMDGEYDSLKINGGCLHEIFMRAVSMKYAMLLQSGTLQQAAWVTVYTFGKK